MLSTLCVQDYYNKRKLVLLAVVSKAKKKDTSAAATSCIVYRPNTGRQPRSETFSEIRKKYRRVVDYDAARYHWEDLYDSSSSACLHAYMYVTCVFVLHLYLCYTCIYVTCVFMLHVYLCDTCIYVTRVFLLDVYLCYTCIYVTRVFI